MKNYPRIINYLIFRSPSKQTSLGKDLRPDLPVKVSKWRIGVFIAICCVTPILFGCCFVTSNLTIHRLTASKNNTLQLRNKMDHLRSGHLGSYLHSTDLVRCPRNLESAKSCKNLQDGNVSSRRYA